ncbi:MAG: tetratricopeptide repeat protein, partial [Luteolibacter sp.]
MIGKTTVKIAYLALIAGALAVTACSKKNFEKQGEQADSTQEIIPPDDQVHAGYAGSETCKRCHEAEFREWKKSNHGLAEREFDLDMDGSAFSPRQSLAHGEEQSEMFLDADGVAKIITKGFKNERSAYRVVRVIGNDPLRQFLISGPGGRLQTCNLSYDPKLGEWFDVHEGSEREVGDWGHWTGQGMNWNAMCAACHNTRLRKNYQPGSNQYHTKMAEMSVGCEACHGPMKKHVEWQQDTPPGYSKDDLEGNRKRGLVDPTIKPQSKTQMLETCAQCHSRRNEITGDMVPGEPFFDHFSLTVTDGSDLYYPDGQVRDENFVYSSFLSSKMHHAGVTCGDCHEPHSNKLLIAGNMLCMRCHVGGGDPPAPVIVPETHSPCTPGTAGHDCTSCHMPHTTYMQRHPRRDHGFTIPDPLLTREYGIPNACNRCHSDQSVDWAIEKAESFYGEKLDRPTRRRAILVARARRGEADARDGLLRMLDDEPIPAWRATACHLLVTWVMEPRVIEQLLESTEEDSPLVREAAVRTLLYPSRNQDPAVRARMEKLLDDPSRSVRVAAAWALAETLDLNSKAGRELSHMLDHNSDQPTGRMQLGQFAYLRGDMQSGIRQIRMAIEWDPNSPPLHHDLAIMLNAVGDRAGATAALRDAVRLDPNEGEYRYKLALVLAESGDIAGSAAELEKVTKLDPENSRAWYNLGLAYNSMNRPQDAIHALLTAERAQPSDPMVPYARATIHARMGQRDLASDAAKRAIQV